jgi:hypothetical protein
MHWLTFLQTFSLYPFANLWEGNWLNQTLFLACIWFSCFIRPDGTVIGQPAITVISVPAVKLIGI